MCCSAAFEEERRNAQPDFGIMLNKQPAPPIERKGKMFVRFISLIVTTPNIRKSGAAHIPPFLTRELCEVSHV